MSINIKKITVGVFLLVSLSVFFVLFRNQKMSVNEVKKIQITTSIYPLQFLAETIGGNYVVVNNLTPAGAEPHDFEPATRDLVELGNKDIILFNGGGLEGYENKVKNIINPKKTILVIIGSGIMNNRKDPHIWLDPLLYKKEAAIVARVLVQVDPSHSSIYQANLRQLENDLDVLHNRFVQKLSNCSQNTIITSHKAFSYLAERYKFTQVSIAGLSPDQEPSSKTLADITTFAKKNNIRYIFFEELASPAVAKTVAQEVGAETLVLNPLEGITRDEINKGQTYATIQNKNLAHLQIALECTQQ